MAETMAEPILLITATVTFTIMAEGYGENEKAAKDDALEAAKKDLSRESNARHAVQGGDIETVNVTSVEFAK